MQYWLLPLGGMPASLVAVETRLAEVRHKTAPWTEEEGRQSPVESLPGTPGCGKVRDLHWDSVHSCLSSRQLDQPDWLVPL